MSSQLGRTLLSRRSSSADQQDATPDEAGSYGELMDAIDRIIEPAQAESEPRSRQSWGSDARAPSPEAQ